jgi:pimeloyl-ACP methyl ester carboxylesterase
MTERIVQANGVQLCTEPFGEGADPPILLIMGIGASMLWWEEGFCRMLADGGRFVIRYDHRDTGRSVTDPPGRPGYTGADLTADGVGVLDAYEIAAAHLVGVSAGGGIAQELALDCPDRVRSLTLISTSPVTPGGRALPSPTAEFGRFVTTVEVDWSDSESVIKYLVGYWRLLSGEERPFDEAVFRALASRDVGRARDFRAAQNHDLLRDDGRSREPLSSISFPTLVIHGTVDPMFPIGPGEALAEQIPDAHMLRLEGAGHGVYRADWEAIVAALLEHT